MHKLVKVKVYGCLWNQILYNTTHFLHCSWNESREIIPSAPESTNRNYHSFLNIQNSNNPLHWTCLPLFTPYFNKDAFFGFLKFFIKKYLYMKLPFPLAWYPSKSQLGQITTISTVAVQQSREFHGVICRPKHIEKYKLNQCKLHHTFSTTFLIHFKFLTCC